MKMKPFMLCILVSLIAAVSCQDTRLRTAQKTESIMGTDVTITVVAPSLEECTSAIDAGMAEIRRMDAMMSLYKDTSEITKVNRAAGLHPVPVSPEMIEVTNDALEASRISGGVFDITIGPLVVLWQMRLKEGKTPADGEIARVRKLVDYRKVRVDAQASTIYLARRGMIMDLGGMKGYIADRVAGLFRKRGITNALIALAGDIWALGRREDGKPWRIGIQHPREKDKILAVLELSDKYVSTSGDYERFVIREKKRYHHIIDPRTGRPSTGIISATLVGDRGARIDPLAKAPFILGSSEGMKFVQTINAEAVIVDDEGTVFMTDGIRQMTASNKP